MDTSGTSRGLNIISLSKTFPGARALSDVRLEAKPGSVHALLGHNGSGKSTLIKVLAGVYTPDPGSEIRLHGKPFSCSAGEAEERGMRFVHQDLGIIDELTAMENIALTLGYRRTRTKRIDWQAQRASANALLEHFQVDLDISAPMTTATAVQRSAVAIARALGGFEAGSGVLVLDEPTAALPPTEVDNLFDIIRHVRELNTAVVYVSHRLDEITRIADELTVLREGSVVLTSRISEMNQPDVANAIAGREINVVRDISPAPESASTVFEVRNLSGSTVRNFDIEVRSGEIVGIAGLVGSGQDALPYLLSGLRSPNSGVWTIHGQTVDDPTYENLREAGLALVPADRTRESTFAEMTVHENMTLGILDGLRTRYRSLPVKIERRTADEWLAKVHTPQGIGGRQISTLSGGNQQKIVLARWLATRPTILMLAEPTAGVDIGARQSIYDELRDQAKQGLGVVVSSTDVEDLTAICERVLVMSDGRVTSVLEGDLITTPALLSAMEGRCPGRDAMCQVK